MPRTAMPPEERQRRRVRRRQEQLLRQMRVETLKMNCVMHLLRARELHQKHSDGPLPPELSAINIRNQLK